MQLTRKQASRTFCHHCSTTYPDIWTFKAHQDACPVVRTMRRSSTVGGLLAGLTFPVAAWLAAPAPLPPTPVVSATSTVPAGLAEAPQLVRTTPVEIAQPLVAVKLVDDKGFEFVTGEHEAAVAEQPKLPEVEGAFCFATLDDYLDQWDATGMAPTTSCILPYEPAQQGEPGTVAMVRDPEWDAS